MNPIGSFSHPLSSLNPLAGVPKEVASSQNISQQRVADDEKKLQEAFQDFVGQTFYSHLIKSLRKSVGKSSYMHGGRAEEVFQAQLDQRMVQEMSRATADQFAGPMFKLFNLNRGA